MAFGRDSKPSRIYAFAAAAPIEGAQAIDDQMYLMHKYKNKLVENERDRRARSDAAIIAAYPRVGVLDAEIAALTARIDALEASIKARNKGARKRTTGDAERAEFKALKAERKSGTGERTALRAAAFADAALSAALKAIDTEAYEATKVLQADSGLMWGNYLFVNNTMSGAKKGKPPKFRRWSVDGAVGVQIQGGMSWAQLRGCGHQQLRLELLPVDTTPKVSQRRGLAAEDRRRQRELRGLRLLAEQEAGTGIGAPECTRIDEELAELEERSQQVRLVPIPTVPDPGSGRQRKRRRAIVWLRIGSEGAGNRIPIWGKIPIILHREPPEDARIKWAYVFRRKVGPRVVWEMQFTLSRESWVRDDQATEGLVGLDVNWRLTPDGLRVATAVDAAGVTTTLTIPRPLLDCWARCEEIQSARDRAFNEMRGRIAGWIGSREGLGEAWRDRFATLSLWQSPQRLARAVWEWGKDRQADDGEMFEAAAAWRRQEMKEYDAQVSLKRKAIRKRNELYNRFAVQLAARYGTIAVEDVNWKDCKRAPTIDGVQNKEAMRVYGHVGAVGKLVELVTGAAHNTARIAPFDTTNTCNECGTVNSFDHRNLFHTCTHCGTTWDQDVNAAINLLNATAGLLQAGRAGA